MKIFAISDLHLCISGAKPMEIFGDGWLGYLDKIKEDWNSKVSDDDIVLVAGDISWAMKLEEAEQDLKFFENLKGIKVLIRGNHDYWWQSITNVRCSLPKNVYALQNDAIKFGNYVICGTRGWGIPADDFIDAQDEKIFKREALRIDMALSSAKRLCEEGDEIICMVHYPPFNHSKKFSEYIGLMKKYDVKTCVFGHIHSHKGNYNLYEKLFGIDFYLTSCDLLQNKLVEITKKEI